MLYNPQKKYKSIIFILFCLIVLSAYLFRTYSYVNEALKFSSFVPFTLESAMMYSYSQDIANGTFQDKDKSLVGLENVSVTEQMSTSLEYFLGYGYRLKSFLFGKNNRPFITNFEYGIDEDFVNWTRVQLRFWASLTAGFIFIWILLLEGSLVYASLGGLLFSVAPAAIARATGQDILKENFAIPLIISCFVIYFWYLKNPNTYKLILLACAIVISLMSWDMTQLCLAFWVACEIGLTACMDNKETNYLPAWITIYTASVIAGIFSPYLVAHNFLQSPTVSVLLPVLIVTILCGNHSKKVRLVVVSINFGLFGAIWMFLMKNFGYSNNYLHFWNLLIAKIRFCNIKPLNPLLLDFDSRILWTPALHSATVDIFRSLFGFTLIFFAVTIFLSVTVSALRKSITIKLKLIWIPLFLSGIFFVLFIFMVRFHALAIPFICVALPSVVYAISIGFSKPTLRILSVALLVSVVFNDASRSLHIDREYYGGENEQLALIKELNKSNVSGETFLADFTLSPMLKAYCKAKIVLIPKFELKQTRDRVERYIDLLYHGTEKDFMEFCNIYRAKYFVFDKGMIGGRVTEDFLHPWSIRYMAAANVLATKSPVYNFFYSPEKMEYFYEIDDQFPSRFVIFKVITRFDIEESDKLYEQAINYYRLGNCSEANKRINLALQMNPKNPKIRFLYYTLNNEKWPKIMLLEIRKKT